MGEPRKGRNRDKGGTMRRGSDDRGGTMLGNDDDRGERRMGERR